MDHHLSQLAKTYSATPTDSNAHALARVVVRARGGVPKSGEPRKILVSGKSRGGWSTWGSQGKAVRDIALTWAPLIAALEAGEDVGKDHPAVISMLSAMGEVAEESADEFHFVGLDGLYGLTVREVYGPFRVEFYFGSESVLTSNEMIWPF